MRFNHLVLEGDRETEKKLAETHLPAYTKEEYLRRKRRKGLLPLFNRSFFLCRLIEEELKRVEIDGSGKITICAHHIYDYYPEEKKYICDGYFKISIYYLETEQIDALDKAIDDGNQTAVMFGILRESLLDIAKRSNCSDEVKKRIEEAFDSIEKNHFTRQERIKKLTKRSKTNGLTAHMYRLISEETDEVWYVRISDRKGNVLHEETINPDTRYIDRLGSRRYAKAEWRGDTYVVTDNFDRVSFRISV